MSEQPLLSICISSFNNVEKVVLMTSRLLRLNDSRLEVVVCDDGSDYPSRKMLTSLVSKGVNVYENEKNLGACPNWYETINRGRGKYILHVLDRDYIDFDVLNDLLVFLEENDFGVGYLGITHSKVSQGVLFPNFTLYEAGETTTALVGGIPLHPTGFVVRKDCWESNRYKKYFYDGEKYGIYPHTYVMTAISMNHRVMLFSKVFCRYVYTQSHRSNFYNKKKVKGFWWEPHTIFHTCECFLSEFSNCFSDEEQRNAFISNVYRDSLFRGTIGYRWELMNKRSMAHYGLPTCYISTIKVLLINWIYMFCFWGILWRNSLSNSAEMKDLIKFSWLNAREIVDRGY